MAKQGIRASLVRTLGFARKELFSIFRQPRLLLTLVIGPFLILLVFGLGYQETLPPLRTLLVLGSEEAKLAADREELSEAFGGAITLEGTTTDATLARERLDDGEVDMVIIAPEDPLASLDDGKQATFQVVHGEIDPVLRSNIALLARLSVDEINRRVLSGVVTEAQDRSQETEPPLGEVRQASSELVAALESGDQSRADAEIASLREELEAVETATGQTNSLYSSVAAAIGATGGGGFNGLDENLEAASSSDQQTALAAAREIDASLVEMESTITGAQGLDPNLMVSPFRADVQPMNDAPREPGVFYSPGTLVVLLQHLAMTVAILSLVRERQLGLTEVFRASPLRPGEAVVGKYLGFVTLALAAGAVLTVGMMAFGIQVSGSVISYVAVMVLVILASLGLGFAMSGLARTDTQAVQYAMITLLLSIFFTGFVLPLEQLAIPVQVVSYLLPATYGIRAMHDIVFRDTAVDPVVLAGLVGFAMVMAVAAWWTVRREVVYSGNGKLG